MKSLTYWVLLSNQQGPDSANLSFSIILVFVFIWIFMTPQFLQFSTSNYLFLRLFFLLLPYIELISTLISMFAQLYVLFQSFSLSLIELLLVKVSGVGAWGRIATTNGLSRQNWRNREYLYICFLFNWCPSVTIIFLIYLNLHHNNFFESKLEFKIMTNCGCFNNGKWSLTIIYCDKIDKFYFLIN